MEQKRKLNAIGRMSDGRVMEAAILAARTGLLAFMQFVWWMPQPLVIGRHTRAICRILTQAVFDWMDGKSTYVIINVPFRHGKSDIVSRALPAWFLGVASQFQPDVMMTGYGASIVKEFMPTVKKIIASDAYQTLFPGVRIDGGRDRADTWSIEGSAGVVNGTGLGGAITGKGFHLGIVDDYCKNREEAFSTTLRESTWQSFTTDFMTRRNAPANIVVVCATPWHPDDVTGRILRAVREDEHFPKFRHVSFPARSRPPRPEPHYEYLL